MRALRGGLSLGIRRRLLLWALLLGSGVVAWRAVTLQWLEHETWAARAEAQQRQREAVPAPRGTIYDRNGIPLAVDREVYRVAIAPHEVTDRDEVVRRLREELGLTAAAARSAVDSGRRWVVLPGRHDPAIRERLGGLTGVYFEPELERAYPQGELALEIIGRVGSDGRALSGLELELDSILRGRAGSRVLRRDGRGEPIPGSMLYVEAPVPGADVFLTIDASLQEIVEASLADAIAETSAEGGDLVIIDPETGEILAGATHRRNGGVHWRAVTDPYEPGSTIKPFSAAALLAGRHATSNDSVFAENGRYQVGSRTITDVQPYGWLTLRDALRVSSNVAMVKFSERLEPAEHYGYLRDAGFGTPTGVPYPSEASGVLRRPSEWSRYSQGSLAIGYEVSVTPLQMVLAYGAIANGGVLMEPRLVREVRSRDGRVLRKYEPREVRRVFPEWVAREVASTLAEVVESGSGREAGLGPFRVAGKTGTARIFDGASYLRAYTASFAGFFPAEEPQLAFLVKLDRPQGDYYGGLTAAPVTRRVLTAALAARSSPLDRSAVAAVDPRRVGTGFQLASTGEGTAHAAPAAEVVRLVAEDGVRTTGAAVLAAAGIEAEARAVPNVAGLPVRDAVRALHRAGFSVVVEGAGLVSGTRPEAGAAVAGGETVVVRASEVGR
ncbi:MAG TPA: penicillin-binding transpeptidase domain-containing protein [Longimicrobiales bacterium]|nr:penicillin-binding transpeptidase domain-containing protein [Longimicrobiales bacterium]